MDADRFCISIGPRLKNEWPQASMFLPSLYVTVHIPLMLMSPETRMPSTTSPGCSKFSHPAAGFALRIVLDAFPPRDRGQRPLEIVLSRRPDTLLSRAGATGVKRESTSWT